MIIGGHPITAAAIARRAGMIGTGDDAAKAAVTGAELAQMTEA